MTPTILIVEDNDHLRKSLCDWIRVSFPECAVLEAKRGEEAVTLALSELPHIVVMDVGLPEMNGIEATRRIKSSAPQVHVVILTIHEENQYRADAEKAGADAYISKRKMHSQLIPVLSELLKRLPMERSVK